MSDPLIEATKLGTIDQDDNKANKRQGTMGRSTKDKSPKDQSKQSPESEKTVRVDTNSDAVLRDNAQDSNEAQAAAVSTDKAKYIFGIQPPMPKAGTNLQYRAAPMYDRHFNSNCQPVTLSELDLSADDGYSSSSEDETVEITLPATKFLFVLLLGIAKPKTDKSILSYTAYKSMGKRGKTLANYKVKYTWASLHDTNGRTAVTLETTNDSHNLFFHHNKAHTGFTVGEKFAILTPRAVGRLPTGSIIIETDQPFIQLTAPSIKTVPFNSNTAEHDLRYFALKKVKVSWSKTHLPVIWRTNCNATVCDRLTYRNKTTQVCGCFGQNSKNDTSARNIILKFDVKFRDSENNKVCVENFTSLRTTRIFFKNQNIIGDYDTLTSTPNRNVIQTKFMKTIRYINQNGGWTIVGWHIRGEIEDDSKEEADTNRLSEKLKPNISYMYPTLLDPTTLPSDCVFGAADLLHRIDSNDGSTTTPHGDATENL